MDLPSLDLISILYKLMPGLLAAAVFHSLTPFPRRDVFDRIAAALLFTLAAEIAVSGLKPCVLWAGTHLYSFGDWTPRVELAWASLLAGLIAFGLAVMLNQDKTHKWLREKRFTKRTSLPSQWFSAFSCYECYVVLNLRDGRRILGWAREWPDEPGSGHFILLQACWLLDDGRQADLVETEAVLIAGADVEFVEFLKQASHSVYTTHKETIALSRSTLLSLRKDPLNEQPDSASTQSSPATTTE